MQSHLSHATLKQKNHGSKYRRCFPGDCCLILSFCVHDGDQSSTFGCFLVHGIVAAILEGSAPGNFGNFVNFSTALVMHFSMDKINLWMPP